MLKISAPHTLPYCPDCGADRVAGAMVCSQCRAAFAEPWVPIVPLRAPLPARLPSAVSVVDLAGLEGVASHVVPFPARWTGTRAGQVDDPEVLAGPPQDRALDLAEPCDAMASEASVPDDVELMTRDTPRTSALGRMHLHLVAHEAARVDDADRLGPPPWRAPAPAAPTPSAAQAAQAAQATAPSSRNAEVPLHGDLAREWSDAAERPIPRKDLRSRGDDAPVLREVLLQTRSAPVEAAPRPEPTVAYVANNRPAPTAARAPWASFGGAAKPPPAPKAPPADASTPSDAPRTQDPDDAKNRT